MTICINCKHYCKSLREIGGYNFICQADFHITMDYVTGEPMKWYGYCRDINPDGRCSKYEEATK
jgi:hypothetical protein